MAGTSTTFSIRAPAGPPAVPAGTTVISRDAELADAAATALMVAGPERFAEIAAHMGIDTALLVSSDGQRAEDPCDGKRLH